MTPERLAMLEAEAAKEPEAAAKAGRGTLARPAAALRAPSAAAGQVA